MPTQKIVTLYEYDELPTDAAKEAARDWFRDIQADYFDDTLSWDDFIAICECMGVSIGTLPRKGRNGHTYQEPQIRYSGFWSQGDGASFAGGFIATGKAGKSIRAYAPQDSELHRIADEIDDIASRCPHGLTAEIRLMSSRYVHENTMEIDGMTFDSNGEEMGLPERDNERLTGAIRDLARWLYRYLRDEYEFRQSREELEEGIRANGYTFTETGKRED